MLTLLSSIISYFFVPSLPLPFSSISFCLLGINIHTPITTPIATLPPTLTRTLAHTRTFPPAFPHTPATTLPPARTNTGTHTHTPPPTRTNTPTPTSTSLLPLLALKRRTPVLNPQRAGIRGPRTSRVVGSAVCVRGCLRGRLGASRAWAAFSGLLRVLRLGLRVEVRVPVRLGRWVDA